MTENNHDRIKQSFENKDWPEIKSSDSWNIFKIMSEFVEGYESLSKIGPCVSVFGSARTKPGTKYYEMAVEIGQKLAAAGLGVITGGGPGIMEAGNKGASKEKGASVKLRALNSIPEFKTREGIDEVKSIFINQEFPDDYSNKEIHKFTNKFRDFDVDNNQLIYRPAKLRVVYPDEREDAMKKVFEDKKRGLGLGLNAFYHQVCMSYLNIQKKHTDAFLENQGEYRVQKIQKKRINAPVKATAPNRRWGVDLIDMNAYPLPQNDQHNRIMAVVDFFSGYVFVRPMTNKENPTIRDWLDHICQTDARNTYPKAIHADGEFQKAKVLKDWYDYHGIKLIKSTSYTPTSNGKLERQIRKI